MKEALVVRRKNLFRGKAFQGFIEMNDNFLDLIMDNHEYQPRNDELEINPEFKQIVPYVVIVNPGEKKVLGYFREGKFCLGVGLHLDRIRADDDLLLESIDGEVRNIVLGEISVVPNILGFMNEDRDEYGEVHLGVLCVCENSENIVLKDSELNARYYSLEEISEIINSGKELDCWTRLGIEGIRNWIGV